MRALQIQSKNLKDIKIVVNYLSFVFHIEVKTKSKDKNLNFVFQFIKNTKWHFGYTDLVSEILALKSPLIGKYSYFYKTFCQCLTRA